MVNYEWVFGNPECIISLDGMSQIVKVIHWRLIGTEDEFTGQVYSTTTLPTPEDPATFTPYDELTKDWFIQQVENYVDIVEIKANIDGQIELQKNPITDNPPLPFIQ